DRRSGRGRQGGVRGLGREPGSGQASGHPRRADAVTQAAVTAAEREHAAPIAAMALAAIGREDPSHVTHLLLSAADVRPPRELTPAFYGSFDWHSAVHGHWCIARLARRHPGASFARAARAALEQSLTRDRLAAEVAYMGASGREGFERPYGLAWLLQLAAEPPELP